MNAPTLLPLLYLLGGILCCSTSVILIKVCTIDPVMLSGLRLLLAAIFLSPVAYLDWRQHRSQLNWSHLRDTVVPGLAIATHFVVWSFGARMTPTSNGTLIVNLSPIVMPFLLALLIGEKVTRKEILATVVVLIGLAILFASDYHYSPETLLGDIVCFVAMLFFALYLTLGRKYRHHPTTWLYIVPLYAIGGLSALALTPFLSDPTPLDWSAELPYLLGMVLFPTIAGHSLLLTAVRYLRGQVVTVLNMCQFMLATIWGWILLGDVPQVAFYPAAILTLVAGGLVLSQKRVPPQDGVPSEEPLPQTD